MRMLFEMDAKNYPPEGTRFSRPSVRAVIIQDENLLMVYSQKYDYYKFPGGGIEPGETQIETLIREVREETGFRVAPQSIQEYGCVHRIEKGFPEDIFEQNNYYYLCSALPETAPVYLETFEKVERFIPRWITPAQAIAANRSNRQDPLELRTKYHSMIEREARVLELLIQEGYFPASN